MPSAATTPAAAHQTEAQRLGLELRVVPDERLGWDVDVPEDLAVLDSDFPLEPGATR